MANHYDIAHRFANKLAGRNGSIKSGNVSYEGRNYYSYSTVFGQWVDMEKNVCIVFEGSTSPSSSKHKLYRGLFPKDVNVFPYNDGRGGWYSYDGCDLMGWSDEFTLKHRYTLIGYYLTKIYNSLAAINGGKSNGLEIVAERDLEEYWGHIERLCALYKDTTINKWCKQSKDKDKVKLAKMLAKGSLVVPYLVDQLFGKGTWMTYWDYCARYRNAAKKRESMEMLCNRLGIRSPYEKWGGYSKMSHDMSADQIRKLSAKERLDIHFQALAYIDYRKHEDERTQKYWNGMHNAFKWIVGYEPEKECWGNRYRNRVTMCRNMYTGEVYNLETATLRTPYGMKFRVDFEYDDFRKAEDKEKWVADFYAECAVVAKNCAAWDILRRIDAHQENKGRYFWEKGYIVDDYLREKLADDAEKMALVLDYIERQDKYWADEQARERAAAIARAKREEEERKEKEYREQVKQEQIQECVERGADGMRDLWRLHLASVCDAERTANSNGVDDDFFYLGGNVLLRLNLNKDKVETSKDIRIPVDTCKKMWKIVSKWHENPNSFKPMEIDTKGSGKYTISSYKNDILTAGCHKIAYTEMERMYKEIINE